MQYFLRLRDERSALSRLDDILGSETRNAVAKHELIEIVRTTKDRVAKTDQALVKGIENVGTLYPIKVGLARKSSSKFLKKLLRSFQVLELNCSMFVLNELITMRLCAVEYTSVW